MVEISRRSPRGQREASQKKTPLWLFAVYALFILSCLNAFRTYKNQKELVRLKVEQEREHDVAAESRYGAGAEEHVVTAGVGSSQYGASVKAADKKNNKRKKVLGTNFKGIRPAPSDGSKDYTTSHPPTPDFKGFGFYVMADTPYSESVDDMVTAKIAKLRNVTENHPEVNLAFALHLGGTRKSSQYCNESAYEHHATMVEQFPSPTFVTPGKSDWFDCQNQDEAFGFFVKHLGEDLNSKGNNPVEALRAERSEKNPELFRLLYEGILVVGLHLIDPPDEFVSSRDKRMETSMKWLAESVEEQFAKHEIRGVVLVGHAGKSERNQRFFGHAKKYFAGGERSKLPVVYLHGGDEWKVDKNSSPFYFVQVDQRGLAEPIIVDVAPQTNGKAQHLRERNDMQLVLKGLFRLDWRAKA